MEDAICQIRPAIEGRVPAIGELQAELAIEEAEAVAYESTLRADELRQNHPQAGGISGLDLDPGVNRKVSRAEVERCGIRHRDIIIHAIEAESLSDLARRIAHAAMQR